MFAKFSRQTQYYRFFGYIGDVTHETLVRYTQIDYDRELALIAEMEVDDEKIMAGVVRLVADTNGESAEFAIVIADEWQGLGLGNEFTDIILSIARKNGIKRIYATVLQANTTMLHMFRKRNFNIKNLDYETVYADLVLSRLDEEVPEEVEESK